MAADVVCHFYRLLWNSTRFKGHYEGILKDKQWMKVSTRREGENRTQSDARYLLPTASRMHSSYEQNCLLPLLLSVWAIISSEIRTGHGSELESKNVSVDVVGEGGEVGSENMRYHDACRGDRARGTWNHTTEYCHITHESLSARSVGINA